MATKVIALGCVIVSLLLVGGCQSTPHQSVAHSSSQQTSDSNPFTSDYLHQLAQRAKSIEIIRDDFGIPHIYAKTDADAVFGLLYAQAEDDFYRIERNYIWAMGRLAEVEGETALWSDLRARMYMRKAQAIQMYEQAPDWLKALCDGFAQGLNYYLATHPQVKPKLLTQFEPWMPMYFSEGSIGGDIEQISLTKIAAFYQGAKSPLQQMIAGVDSASKRLVTPQEVNYDEPAGSNGIALSAKMTQSGNAMLLINPHTSFYFRPEVHVVSEQGLNAYGAVTWGQFFVYQGFNQHNGWMHTSTYVDFMDEFIETVSMQDDQLMYLYGKSYRPVETTEVTLHYKQGEHTLSRTFPLYRTHHGPITHQLNGKWVSTKINWDPVNALAQSFIRTKTENLDEFKQMMEIRRNSSNNTVYADKNGQIAYFHGNFVPKRDSQFDYSRPVDGSNPATDWQGIHGIDEIISVVDPASGWLQNANSTPFTAAGEHSPKASDFPKYMAPDPENFRGVHAVQLLKDAQNVTLDGLIELAYDPYLPAFNVLIPGLIAAYDSQPENWRHLQQPIELLRNWNYVTSVDSEAMTLGHFYGLNYLEQGAKPEGFSTMQRIYLFAQNSPFEQRLKVFEDTLAQLDSLYGTWQIEWGEVNRLQRLTGDIDGGFDDELASLPVGLASGRWGALAAFGAKRFETKKLYGYRGNSFVAVVEFGEKVKAKSLLAGGQNADPQSPHFFDQAVPYVNGQFKPVAYYRDDVEQRAVKKYHPGQRQ